MEIKILLLLVLLILGLQAQDPVTIISVSSDPASVVAPIYSSLRGGKLIYIKVQGHSPDPSDNSVFVGNFPCTVPSDGVTDTFISCYTTDTGSYSDINNQAVSLISGGVQVTTSSPYLVNSLASYTPELYSVFPTAGFASSSVNYYGIHRITDLGDGLRFMGDVERLRLGEDLCSRFDVEQAAISATTRQYIQCKESSTQEARKYNVSELLAPGYANHSRYLRRTSFDPQEYFEFTALPTVTAVSPASGNIGGQYLTISGSGFSANPANNSVSVDGNDCLVTSASSDQIKCTLSPKNSSVSSQLPTNSSSQLSGFSSGAGLKYARYAVTSSINTVDKFMTAVRASDTASLGTPVEEGFRADLREGNVYPENEAQVWRGYFTAPVAGIYTFRGTADDYFAVYLTSNYGSAEPAATPLISSGWSQNMDYPFIVDRPTSVASVDLEAQKSYYIEVYHVNTAGVGFFDLAVEVPNSDIAASFQVYQIDNITTASTVQEEVVVFSVVGGSTGTIELGVYRQDSTTFAVTYNKKVNVTYGCTASTFLAALNQFDGYSSYQVSVVRTIYDSNNAVINTTASAARIDYTAKIYLLRPAALQTEQFNPKYYDGFTGTFSQTQTTAHSPLLSGTFTLSVGGQPISISGVTDISYDIDAWSLQTAIRGSGIVGFEQIEVVKGWLYGCGYSCTWLIKYRGFNQAVTGGITVNGASLSGGSTSPNIEGTTKRAYSTNLEFDPVDYRFLSTAASALSVRVTTNGVPSVCTGSCAYSFNTYTEITALSSAGTTLSLALSDPTSIGFVTADISVSVGGLPCAVDGGSSAVALTCTLQTNTDSTAILVAGSVTPVVAIKQYGIAGLASGVSPLSVPLTVTSLSVTTGGNNGGYLINLAGTGFPLDASKMTITVCGNKATIKTITNIRVDFYVPACTNIGAEMVTVAVGTLTDSSLSFTYTDGAATAPTITQLSPASANPGVKGTLEIFGSKFGSNPAEVTVFLSNSSGKVYQLVVLLSNDTYIKTGLPGSSQEGTFTVEVNLATNGDSIAVAAANAFSYAFSVSSVSPSSGSYFGGTLLTISGQNFDSSPQNTLAYVGFTLNWFCSIESITSTEIKCRTPAISKEYTTGSAVQVVVSTRLLILNSCSGSCQFSYLPLASSPALTAISQSTATVSGSATASITLTGTNLQDSNFFAEVVLTHTLTGATTVFVPTSKSATSVVFALTSALTSGNYQVVVRNALGASNSQSLAVKWSVGTTSWASGGSTAGAIVSLTNGGGYPSSIDGLKFSIALTAGNLSYSVNIVSCCTSNSVQI
jgi:hypothetical protein